MCTEGADKTWDQVQNIYSNFVLLLLLTFVLLNSFVDFVNLLKGLARLNAYVLIIIILKKTK